LARIHPMHSGQRADEAVGRPERKGADGQLTTVDPADKMDRSSGAWLTWRGAGDDAGVGGQCCWQRGGTVPHAGLAARMQSEPGAQREPGQRGRWWFRCVGEDTRLEHPQAAVGTPHARADAGGEDGRTGRDTEASERGKAGNAKCTGQSKVGALAGANVSMGGRAWQHGQCRRRGSSTNQEERKRDEQRSVRDAYGSGLSWFDTLDGATVTNARRGELVLVYALELNDGVQKAIRAA
jgi:hypothetical protein